MKWLDKFKYTNYKSKYSKLLLPFLNFCSNRITRHKYCLYEILGDFDCLNVIGSGPSLNKINLHSNTKDIYLTTNSSYLALKGKKPFIHLINDHGYLLKFLLFGLKYKPELIIVVNFTSKKPKGLSGRILNQVNKYLYRKRRKAPVVMINYFDLGINNRDYLREMEIFKMQMEVNSNYSNSGQIMYTLSAMLLSRKIIDVVRVYGIDAGEGGKKHFDGRATTKNHSAFRENNKKIMGEFFELCQSKYSEILNYSYFKNNTDETT